jgi:hypothetical protein
LATTRQFLRIGLQGANFLLSSAVNFSIEKREHLESDEPGAPIAAWHTSPTGRWPAYSVDRELNPVVRQNWQRAVFIEEGSSTVGLVADELQLLTREEVTIERFRPLGPAPGPAGHLFSGAWVRSGQMPILLFEPRALVAYLSQLGGRA